MAASQPQLSPEIHRQEGMANCAAAHRDAATVPPAAAADPADVNLQAPISAQVQPAAAALEAVAPEAVALEAVALRAVAPEVASLVLMGPAAAGLEAAELASPAAKQSAALLLVAALVAPVANPWVLEAVPLALAAAPLAVALVVTPNAVALGGMAFQLASAATASAQGGAHRWPVGPVAIAV